MKDPITEIRRIESDLHRFMQTASEAPRLVHDYLGDLLTDGYVPEEEHETETRELQCDLESAREESKNFREIVEKFRDSIQDTKFLPYDPAAFIALVDELVSIIQNSDTDIFIAADRILDDLSSVESHLEELAENRLNSDTTSPLPTPHTDENQTEIRHAANPHAPTPRRLPGFGAGTRAA